MKKLLAWTLCLLLIVPAVARHKHKTQAPDTIRVACVGNSITEGYGLKNKSEESYPARLQELLGDGYKVMNFGLSGHTLLTKTDRPYINPPKKVKKHRFHEALASDPDIVTIKLGTNDSKTPYDSLLHADFTKDLNALIDSFQALPSHPYIYLCLPIPADGEIWTIRDSVIENEVLPRIKAVAAQRNLPVIDLYTPMKPFPELLQDRIHPTRGGAMIIAEEIARRILLDRSNGKLKIRRR
ncbi:MAG: hypothetical protein IJP70_02000 [Bacteroidales bacterium]|nr:hypothetical protein [Bacteroidales bacterium]